MVTIRLVRGGANKRPYYRIVITDRRRAAYGRCIERVGFFNPLARENEDRLRVDRARVDYWLSQGAKLTDRVANLMKRFAAG